MQAAGETAEPDPLQPNHYNHASTWNDTAKTPFSEHLLQLMLFIDKKNNNCMQDYQTHLTNSVMFS